MKAQILAVPLARKPQQEQSCGVIALRWLLVVSALWAALGFGAQRFSATSEPGVPALYGPDLSSLVQWLGGHAADCQAQSPNRESDAEWTLADPPGSWSGRDLGATHLGDTQRASVSELTPSSVSEEHLARGPPAADRTESL